MKIHNHLRIVTCIAAILLFGYTYGQKVYIDENISYWYNISNELHINHYAYIQDESANIYLEISFNKGAKFDDYFFRMRGNF